MTPENRIDRVGSLLLTIFLLIVGCRPSADVPLPTPSADWGSPPPLVFSTGCNPDLQPRINAPGFGAQEVPFEQTSIAWFGYLSPESNFTDIRVGYNDAYLYVYLAIFDRHLWYEEQPVQQRLTDWDAVTLFLDTSGGEALSPASWKFVAQLYGEPSPERRAAYRWNGANWELTELAFEAIPGWRGNALNNNEDTDRGWAMGFTVPFSVLGLVTAPVEGTTWRIAVITHDRDEQDGPVLPEQFWPPSFRAEMPACWGWLRFGLPEYHRDASATGSLLIVRPTQDSPLVPDADVGGASSNQCPGDENHIWNEWANRNYGHAPDFNIQNQSDVADWPCFSKYYITFSLEGLPAGKRIVSATLTLYQFGSAGGDQARPSWIQVLIAAEDWQEETITWNNAPLAYENIGGTWVDPITEHPGWPGIPRSWDVTYAVARAYARREPLRLVLYESGSAYHSGKYFVSSDTGDWNAAGRPRLEVVWGEP
ncbi:MAG: DNRLRE domain-containing protein [Anaerolineales bacterium]|nr:DNRLRE domain-containing protein [Anaerolineales bacterium]MCX7609814.1 DNRLRE domain-containing protein [Anaerolineales bacterium]